MIFQIKIFIERVLLCIVATMLAVMVVLMLWQVFTRYVLSTPSLYTEEILRFIMIWTGLLGTAYCFGTRKHLALEVALDAASPRIRHIMNIVNSLIIIAFVTATMLIGGFQASISSMQQMTPIMQIPIGLVYLVLPVAAILTIALVGIDLFGLIIGRSETQSDPQETI